jgi:hypothetical protein
MQGPHAGARRARGIAIHRRAAESAKGAKGVPEPHADLRPPTLPSPKRLRAGTERLREGAGRGARGGMRGITQRHRGHRGIFHFPSASISAHLRPPAGRQVHPPSSAFIGVHLRLKRIYPCSSVSIRGSKPALQRDICIHLRPSAFACLPAGRSAVKCNAPWRPIPVHPCPSVVQLQSASIGIHLRQSASISVHLR